MIYIESFDNLQNFATTIKNRKENSVFAKYPELLISQLAGRAEKVGTSSYEEAESLLQNGDKTNLAKLKSASIKDIAKANGYAKNMLKIEKNVCGCLPNIPLYLNGVPNNMLNFKRNPVKSKVINILVNISVCCEVTASQIIDAGASIASIVRELEKNGIRVNLHVACFSKKSNDCVGFIINVEKSSSPLNMLNISYPLINPSMIRRHFFRFIETVPVKISSKFVGGYGQPVTFSDVLKNEPKLNKYKDAVIIDIQNFIGVSVSDMVKTISDKTK